MFKDPLLENPVRWKITVHPKPRGLWRPKMELEWWLEWPPNSTNNPLNIDCGIRDNIQFPWSNDEHWKDVVACDNCSLCKKFNTWQALGGIEYFDGPVRGTSPMSTCEMKKFLNGNKRKLHCYLPWRPGKPDYSDIVEWWAKNFFEPIEREFQRRLEEAYQSEPTEEIVLDSESYRHNREIKKIEKEVKENKPTRKIQIA